MASHQSHLAQIEAAQTLPDGGSADTFRDFATLPAMLKTRAAEHPDRDALVYLDQNDERSAWTYRELSARVDSVAGFLQGQGIKHGDRIATVAHNHADTVVQYLAAWSLGAVVVPINVGEDDERVVFILSNSLVRLAFVRNEYLDRLLALKDNLPALGHVVVCGGSGSEWPSFTDALTHDPAAAQHVDSGDEALIVYTSGTTGHPTGVGLTQANLLVDAAQIARWHGLDNDDRMM